MSKYDQEPSGPGSTRQTQPMAQRVLQRAMQADLLRSERPVEPRTPPPRWKGGLRLKLLAGNGSREPLIPAVGTTDARAAVDRCPRLSGPRDRLDGANKGGLTRHVVGARQECSFSPPAAASGLRSPRWSPIPKKHPTSRRSAKCGG